MPFIFLFLFVPLIAFYLNRAISSRLINADAYKYRRLTLIYYAIVIPVLVYCMIMFRHSSGPCNPGLDIIVFFVTVILTIIMIGVNIYFTFQDKRNRDSLIIHSIVFFLEIIVLCIV